MLVFKTKFNTGKRAVVTKFTVSDNLTPSGATLTIDVTAATFQDNVQVNDVLISQRLVFASWFRHGTDGDSAGASSTLTLSSARRDSHRSRLTSLLLQTAVPSSVIGNLFAQGTEQPHVVSPTLESSVTPTHT